MCHQRALLIRMAAPMVLVAMLPTLCMAATASLPVMPERHAAASHCGDSANGSDATASLRGSSSECMASDCCAAPVRDSARVQPPLPVVGTWAGEWAQPVLCGHMPRSGAEPPPLPPDTRPLPLIC